MAENATKAVQASEEKAEKYTGKIVGAGVGLALGGSIGFLLLGPGAILFAGVICGLIGGALGAAFD
ncbi:hypothetical protein [Methylocystis heyeri]|uniref:Glycine zipper family protein n=1 Tax=Methylocystis heyeri TaxID=391905 RepID=A0A6B8KE23_9HYPH|nr:hypothetical protein [Methylocystis heyeri]QGM46516.1 hypothetical protein H2LOC_012870 [Methylocystis heyeri]